MAEGGVTVRHHPESFDDETAGHEQIGAPASCVVAIDGFDEGEHAPSSRGSGIVVGPHHLLTCWHVVQRRERAPLGHPDVLRDEPWARLKRVDDPTPLRCIARDEELDVALLHSPSRLKVPIARWLDDASLRRWLERSAPWVALGYPETTRELTRHRGLLWLGEKRGLRPAWEWNPGRLQRWSVDARAIHALHRARAARRQEIPYLRHAAGWKLDAFLQRHRQEATNLTLERESWSPLEPEPARGGHARNARLLRDVVRIGLLLALCVPLSMSTPPVDILGDRRPAPAREEARPQDAPPTVPAPRLKAIHGGTRPPRGKASDPEPRWDDVNKQLDQLEAQRQQTCQLSPPYSTCSAIEECQKMFEVRIQRLMTR